MLNNEDYSKVLKKPIKDMTIGDVVEYFDILCARKHGGDEDVKRTASELKARFIMEALYKNDKSFLDKQQGKVINDWYNKNCKDSHLILVPSSYEITQARNYLDSDCRPLPPKMLRDRQRAKELKNLVREFCEDRDAARLIHPSAGSTYYYFDRTNGKTRLTIGSSVVKENQLFVKVNINGFDRYFYVNTNFKRTPFAYNWWKMYRRRITKKLGKIIDELEKGDYNEQF